MMNSIFTAKSNIVNYTSFPQWLFGELPCNYTIGISDPDLSNEDAFRQALSRALFLYILEKGVIIWGKSEVYSSNIENNYIKRKDKNTTHIMLVSNDNLLKNSVITYEVIDTYKSTSDELILYIKFKTEHSDICSDIKMSLESSTKYYNAYSEDIKRKSELIILGSPEIMGDTQGHMYIMESQNAYLEIESLTEKYVKKRRYILEPALIGPDNSMQYNVESLWDTLFLSLIDQLINIQFNNTKFRSVKDEFLINNKLLKNNLQTYKGLDSFSFKPSIKEYKNRKIVIEWNIVNQNK